MIDLMRIPTRFPDAEPAHIYSWQVSAIAWWRDAGERERLVRALSQLTPPEIDKLEIWIAARGDGTTPTKTATLEGMAQTIVSPRTGIPKAGR